MQLLLTLYLNEMVQFAPDVCLKASLVKENFVENHNLSYQLPLRE